MKEISNPAIEAIEAFLDDWAGATPAERVAKRTSSSMEEINAFYDSMLPWMEEILVYLNQYPLEEIPDEARGIANAALAMCEVDNPVRWKETELSSGFDVRAMIEKGSFYDSGFHSRHRHLLHR
ncbi:hypothetical protein U8326_03895 [Tsuneonella sp. CC-YZS046]|uniref:hypothetical protein n=1 Tax=Tsuneonella sp. CC-YZS046 TaxID=3042152 RepID=UPI002D7805A4|nr:hypothetical protein [Tsuneonella sp. CC-YZS046]WRO67321.1 hypothetical protein U8326_03895 [Tsuneonella sp. CC-YZS046]